MFVLSAPDPASGCAACAQSARAKTGMCKQTLREIGRYCFVRRWDSASSARVACHLGGVKHLIRWNFHPRAEDAPLPRHSAPCRHRSARARVRPGPDRVDRRDRRRKIDPCRRRRPAGRRPRIRRSRPHRRRDRVDRSDLRYRGRPRGSRAARSLRAGTKPRVRRRRARHERSARELSAALVDLHGQHEHQVLLDPAAHLDVLDAFANADAERERGRGSVCRLAAGEDRARSTAREPARERRPRGVHRVPARGDRSRRPEARRRRRAARREAGARQRRQAAAPLRRGLSVALRG